MILLGHEQKDPYLKRASTSINIQWSKRAGTLVWPSTGKELQSVYSALVRGRAQLLIAANKNLDAIAPENGEAQRLTATSDDL